MTVAQARTGHGARADNLPARLAAIRAPKISHADITAAQAFLARTGNQDVAGILGLDERSTT